MGGDLAGSDTFILQWFRFRYISDEYAVLGERKGGCKVYEAYVGKEGN